MKHILFLSISPEKQRPISAMLEKMRGKWTGLFPANEAEALNWLSSYQVQVVVVEIQYPLNRNGIDFLAQLQRKNIRVAKIAITDQKIIIDHLRSSGLAQQFLGRVDDVEMIIATIQRAITLGDLLQHNMLQRLISQVQILPSLPSLYLQIAEELNSANPSAERVGQIISQDISMSAKVLQIVNSAYFGLPYPVASPVQATTLLGLEAIRDLVLGIKVFSNFDQLKIRHLGLTRLWHHSVLVGAFSKTITLNLLSNKNTTSYSFVAGLLHDIGKLILAENLPMKYHSAMTLAAQKKIELYEAEEQIFGATHAQVGAYLLWLWNLPTPVIAATAYHHTPLENDDLEITPVTTVHLANAFQHELSSSANKMAPSKVDSAYIEKLGITARVEDVRQACKRLAHQEEL
ncbi:MAG TPA: HDOD domain-containing protein [Anaerolineaceae bacterium]|nr:HDOD domain-containing protein [Anaerolineaceae bacterium]